MHILILYLLISLAASVVWMDSSPYPAIEPDPDLDYYDVIVIGGGEAGVGAAIQAAMLNVTVAMTEETDYIGGMMTAAGVSTMDGNAEGFHRTGVYKNFTQRIIEHYQSVHRKTNICYWDEYDVCFEPGVGQRILREMLDEFNVTLIEQAYPKAAFMRPDGKTLNKVLFSNGKVLRAKVFIDATEYGDLMDLAGTRYRAGNRTSDSLRPDGCVQPFTYTAVVKQYDNMPEFLRLKNPPPGYRFTDWNHTVQLNGSHEVEKYPWSWEFFKMYRAMPDSTRPGRNDLTKTGLNVDTNDVRMNVTHIDRSNRFLRMCDGKLRTLQFLYYIQKNVDPRWSLSLDEGYDTEYNKQNPCPNVPAEFRALEKYMPPIPYIRESRRLFGLYTLTLADTFRNSTRDARQFDDSVAIGDYAEDLHGCQDPEQEFEEGGYRWPSSEPKAFEIPMRALIPTETDALLAAGKLISVSRLANGATRNQPISMLTGQAAGALAGVAAKAGIRPRDVPYKDVQAVLDRFQTIYKAKPKVSADFAQR